MADVLEHLYASLYTLALVIGGRGEGEKRKC